MVAYEIVRARPGLRVISRGAGRARRGVRCVPQPAPRSAPPALSFDVPNDATDPARLDGVESLGVDEHLIEALIISCLVATDPRGPRPMFSSTAALGASPHHHAQIRRAGKGDPVLCRKPIALRNRRAYWLF